MAPVVVDPKQIRSFRDAWPFEAWLGAHHATADAFWLKIHKKGSGKRSVTDAEALDVALCWGWTDAMKTPSGRARKISALVEMLERGETVVPQASLVPDA